MVSNEGVFLFSDGTTCTVRTSIDILQADTALTVPILTIHYKYQILNSNITLPCNRGTDLQATTKTSKIKAMI